MAKPPKRNDMSDMVHRIKTENAKGFPNPPADKYVGEFDADGKPVIIDTPYFGGTRGR